MNKQETFDLVARALVKQGRASFYQDSNHAALVTLVDIGRRQAARASLTQIVTAVSDNG